MEKNYFTPCWPNALRRLWLTVLSLYVFGYELVTAIQLIISPAHDTPLIFNLCILVMSSYALALGRAWLLLGAQRTGLLAWLNPLYEINKSIPIENAAQADSQVGDSA